MSTIDASHLSVIPYLDMSSVDGRFISSATFFAEGQWRMWVPAEDRFLELKIVEPVEMFYWSKAPQSNHDVYIQLLDFVAQQAALPGLEHAVTGMMDDVLNMTILPAKIDVLHASRNSVGSGIRRMVTTEVEYLFSLCRSLFDLLQEIIAGVWKTVMLHDKTVVKRPLKGSFREMVVFEGKPVTSQLLESRFGLPTLIAQTYVGASRFFLDLKTMRDNLVHHGSQVQTIFDGEDGFLIAGHLRPFASIAIWQEEEKQPNNLVPLLPALTTMIYGTLAVCGAFSHAMEQTIGCPPPLVPGMKLFLRCPLSERFLAAMQDCADRGVFNEQQSADEKPSEENRSAK
ncbi:hypothetical protein ABH945_003714 [Paraburkholderia sp. GAS333]|uniref:hypothetical protein n=1 Tax=Paraburkholderia sp. GAS333 TaxID=3156279 RepID=UPI003D2037BA